MYTFMKQFHEMYRTTDANNQVFYKTSISILFSYFTTLFISKND